MNKHPIEIVILILIAAFQTPYTESEMEVLNFMAIFAP